jgi:hypothetical protein
MRAKPLSGAFLPRLATWGQEWPHYFSFSIGITAISALL